jgi:hypothetical protein
MTGGGEERRGAEEEEESNTEGRIGGTRGGMNLVESSNNSRSSTPSLYIAGVIFVRSNGKMPAFSKPLMQLSRAVALSHAQRVAIA